jgi:hypothetical protein
VSPVTARGARALVALLVLELAAARAEPTRVAVAPLTALTEGTAVAELEAVVEAGVAAVPDTALVRAEAVRQALRRAHRRELEACEADPPCLAALGQLAGASTVVAGELSRLGDGQVLYLKAIDVGLGVELGGTTLVVPGRPADAGPAARAAAFRLLAPRAYNGLLALQADVTGATVFVDGQRVGETPLAPLTLPVGTHALRVTHPTYRDFVRFVDVPFGERVEQPVELRAYPVVGDTLHGTGGAVAATPWIKSPWVLAGAGALVAVATAVVVATVYHPAPRIDRDVTVHPPP